MVNKKQKLDFRPSLVANEGRHAKRDEKKKVKRKNQETLGKVKLEFKNKNKN